MFWLSMVLIGPKQHHVIFVICFSFLAELFRLHVFRLPGLSTFPPPLFPARTSLQVGQADRQDR